MNISRAEFISIVKENVDIGTNIEDIKLDDQLSDIGIDSLGFVTLLWAIEDRLKTQIDDQNLESLNSASTVADFISTFDECGVKINIETTS